MFEFQITISWGMLRMEIATKNESVKLEKRKFNFGDASSHILD
jgi:hypothetical protein